MKIAITGHTNGIGQSIANILELKGHEVFGYSISKAYDIGDLSVRDEILNKLDDVDVFINNAYHPTGQFDLLESALNKWAGTNKLIVNVNSKSIYADYVLPSMQEYVEAKQKQTNLINSKRLQSRPQILNVILGLVDTRMSKIFDAKKLNIQSVSELIVSMIELQDTIYVQEIMLDVPDQDWAEITPINTL